MNAEAPPDLACLVANPARVTELPAGDVPALLGALEQLRVLLWARMVGGPAPASRGLTPSAGEQLLTVPEVAAELQFTRAFVYDAVRSGQLAAVRAGKYVRIRRAALAAWLDGHRATALDGRGVPSHSVKPTARRPSSRSHRIGAPVATTRDTGD